MTEVDSTETTPLPETETKPKAENSWRTIVNRCWAFLTNEKNSTGLGSLTSVLTVISIIGGLAIGAWVYFTDQSDPLDRGTTERTSKYEEMVNPNLSPVAAILALREYLTQTKGFEGEVGQSKIAQGLFDAQSGFLNREDLSQQSLRRLRFKDGQLNGVNLEGVEVYLSDLRDSKLLDVQFDRSAFVLSDLSGSDIEIDDNSTVYFSGSRLDQSRVLVNENTVLYLSGTSFLDTTFDLHPSSTLIIDRSDGTGARDSTEDTSRQAEEEMFGISSGSEQASAISMGAAEQALAVSTVFRQVDLRPSTCRDLEQESCQVDKFFDFAPITFIDRLSNEWLFEKSFVDVDFDEAEGGLPGIHWSKVNGSSVPHESIWFELPRVIQDASFVKVLSFIQEEMTRFARFERELHNRTLNQDKEQELLRKSSLNEIEADEKVFLDIIIDKAKEAGPDEFVAAESGEPSSVDGISEYAEAAMSAMRQVDDVQEAAVIETGALAWNAFTLGIEIESNLTERMMVAAEVNDYFVYNWVDDGWELGGIGSYDDENNIVLAREFLMGPALLARSNPNGFSSEELFSASLAEMLRRVAGPEGDEFSSVVVTVIPPAAEIEELLQLETLECEYVGDACLGRGASVVGTWSAFEAQTELPQ